MSGAARTRGVVAARRADRARGRGGGPLSTGSLPASPWSACRTRRWTSPATTCRRRDVLGLAWPNRRITVHLSPATLPKRGPGFDLAIAVAPPRGRGGVDRAAAPGGGGLGEARPRRSAPRRCVALLPAVAARAAGRRPAGGRRRPTRRRRGWSRAPGPRRHDPRRLVAVVRGDVPPDVELDAVDDHRSSPAARARSPTSPTSAAGRGAGSSSRSPRRAGTTCSWWDPPGTGKTMLAARPARSAARTRRQAAVEVTAVHSVAGVDPAAAACCAAPVRGPAPHGAPPPRWWAAARDAPAGCRVAGAPRRALPRRGAGVLRPLLQTLRQPLEHGELVLHRAAGTARYPARFQLVLAANPCPCGRGGGSGRGPTCTCPPAAAASLLRQALRAAARPGRPARDAGRADPRRPRFGAHDAEPTARVPSASSRHGSRRCRYAGTPWTVKRGRAGPGSTSPVRPRPRRGTSAGALDLAPPGLRAGRRPCRAGGLDGRGPRGP